MCFNGARTSQALLPKLGADMQVVEGCLEGTPYSLPADDRSTSQIASLKRKEDELVARLQRVRDQLRRLNLRRETSHVQVTREIFESNAIEGVGPDLTRTSEILDSPAAQSIADNFDRRLFTDAIAGDANLSAVLGLQGARVLAERLRKDVGSGRPITEADLRDLHDVICQGEAYAGMYKRFHVKIGGKDAHEPHLPVDVGPAMHELANWFDSCDRGVGILRAAVAHAWLTHIHPFEDGNGRVARLLANMALAQRGLPPAIVKHKSQRGAYLDALRHSDDGGDILPLAGLFLGTVGRYLIEVEKPRFLRQVFEEEVQRRGNSLFDWWSNTFDTFLTHLNTELRLQRLIVKPLGEMDLESFEYIHDLDSTGNAWLQMIADRDDRELLMWFGYPSPKIRRHLDPDLTCPSVFLSVRNDERSMLAFRKVTSEHVNGLQEFTLVPDVMSGMYVLVKGSASYLSAHDAASTIADLIGQSFRAGSIPKRPLTLFEA